MINNHQPSIWFKADVNINNSHITLQTDVYYVKHSDIIQTNNEFNPFVG